MKTRVRLHQRRNKFSGRAHLVRSHLRTFVPRSRPGFGLNNPYRIRAAYDPWGPRPSLVDQIGHHLKKGISGIKQGISKLAHHIVHKEQRQQHKENIHSG